MEVEVRITTTLLEVECLVDLVYLEEEGLGQETLGVLVLVLVVLAEDLDLNKDLETTDLVHLVVYKEVLEGKTLWFCFSFPSLVFRPLLPKNDSSHPHHLF
jgi:hypothetical protein